MSMNFSQHFALASALLIATSSLLPMVEAQGSLSSSYYQTISIDGVLKSKPAIVYVSPKYQVTILVNGREITGVSLELSKQKLFSVTLADNHRMIFLDTLTSKGQADLNLILDDEQVLPLHLMVKDSPTGTRIYTFESSGGTENADAPTVTPTAVPAPATPNVPPQQPTPAPVTPPSGSAKASPSAVIKPAEAERPVATQTAMSSTLQPLSVIQSAKEDPNPKVAARMEVRVVRSGLGGTLTLRLTSPAGVALRADINNLRLSDGQTPVSYTVAQGIRGRLLPVETTLRITNLPATLTVSWPVTSIFPSGQYMLRALVRVN